MNGQFSSGFVLDPSNANFRSDSKLLIREKRSSAESGDKSELTRKRIKMRDLESIFRSDEIENHDPESVLSKETKDQFHFDKKEKTSQITEEPAIMILDAFKAASTGPSKLSLLADAACLSLGYVATAFNPIDVNAKARIANNTACDVTLACIDDSAVSLLAKQDKDCDPNFVKSRDTGLDLNAEYTSNSVGEDPSYPYKIHDRVKSREDSECGSSTGPFEENDSFRVWKELKQNSLLSSSHGGIPMPKQHGRKRKNDVLRKNIDLAKREQVNRFTKIAAPSGLLNRLNPGIINHVRNSKQVHSIIEALVRSEKLENRIQSRSASHLKGAIMERKGPAENLKDSGVCQSGLSLEGEPPNTLSASRSAQECHLSSCIHTNPSSSEHNGSFGDYDIAEKTICDEVSGASHLTSDHEDENLTLKLSSSISMTSENASVSNEETANEAIVSSLSIKAATVASQWLELLYQDIKGRLAALKRSKKRVQAVILTELPFLMSREFSSNPENDPYSKQSSSTGCPNPATPDMHRARWFALFDQMEKALSEEGQYLECWLSQVKEMQLHCKRGLQCVNWQSLQLLGRPENNPISKKENSESEPAVQAAAASIYSTCNYVMATEDILSS